MRRWEVIIDLIQKNGFRRIAEVGVCKFQTAFPVMEACDLDDYYMIDPKFAFPIDCKQIRDKVEQGATWSHVALLAKYQKAVLMNMTSEQAAPLIPDGFLDLVYIDGLHDYSHVLQDITLWTPKVMPGGIAIGHDYENSRFPGVKKAVDGYYGAERVKTVPVKGCRMWVVEL